jgi:hypothetical protein
VTGRGDAYRRRDADAPRQRCVMPGELSRGPYLSAVVRGEYRSDICPATAADAGLEPYAHSGGRPRLAQPRALTPMGTVVAAHPERRVGFVYGASIGRAS